MTECEARHKWCPFVRQRPQMHKEEEKCIASDCACWVWDLTREEVSIGTAIGEKGHCGLIR